MSVDAVTYRRAELLTRRCGSVVNVGETITSKEFSNRILSAFGRDLANAKCTANDASKNIVSITRISTNLYDVEWIESK